MKNYCQLMCVFNYVCGLTYNLSSLNLLSFLHNISKGEKINTEDRLVP